MSSSPCAAGRRRKGRCTIFLDRGYVLLFNILTLGSIMKIRYVGSAAVQEYQYTGVNALWQPGQVAIVDGDRLTKLLLAPGFVDDEIGLDEVAVTAKTNPLTGVFKNSTGVKTFGSTVVLEKQRGIAPFKLYGQVHNSAGVLGSTMHATYEIPFDFIGLRVHVENMASTAQINQLVAVAVSNDAIATPYTPSGAFVNALFSGAATFATTACTSGAGTNDAVTTDTVSDWIALSSIPRTDGGTGRLLAVRQYVPAAGNTTANRVDIANTSIALSVTKVKAFYKAGDFVTTPAGFTTPSEWGMAPAIWFEFLTADGVITFIPGGDSVTQGSDGGPMPNVGGAARLMSESLYGKVALCNQGWASQKSDAFFANVIAKVQAIRPSAASFTPWSPNDTDKYTQAGIDRCKILAMRFVAECQKVGTTPILVTPAPVNSLSATDEGFRRQIVTFVKNACANGVAILADRDAVYTEYSTASGGYKSGLFATPLHPNAAGYALEAAQVWQPIFSD